MVTEREEKRIEYVKPSIDDLGMLSVVYGGNACSGGEVATGEWCRNGGSPGTFKCGNGPATSE